MTLHRVNLTPHQAEVIRRALMTAPLSIELALPVLQALMAQISPPPATPAATENRS